MNILILIGTIIVNCGNAIGIARQSSSQQDTKEEQLEWIEETAKKNKIHLLPPIAETCKGFIFPIEYRKQLLDSFKKNKISHIVTFRLDRLGRNSGATISLLDELNEINKIKLITSEGTFDYSQPNDQFFVKLNLLIAELEQDQRMDRVLLKVGSMLKKGEYPRKTVPFGYKKLDNDRLKPFEWSSTIINDLYDSFIKFRNYSKVSRYINNKYYKTTGRRLSPGQIENILQNKIYIGYYQFGKNIFGDGGKSTPHNNIVVISEDKFKKVQNIVDEIQRRYSRKKTPLYSRIIEQYGLEPVFNVLNLSPPCPKCGSFDLQNNGKGQKNKLQKKFICKKCKTQFRSPLYKQIKRIEKAVATVCRDCGKNNEFTIIQDGSFLELKCNNCRWSVLYKEFSDKHQTINQFSSKKTRRKSRKKNSNNSNLIQGHI